MTTTSSIDRSTLRPVAVVVGGGHHHWVGDGFRVERHVGPGDQLASMVSPFLLLDYHAPYEYGPTRPPAASASTPTAGSRPSPSPSRERRPPRQHRCRRRHRSRRRAVDDRRLRHPAQGVPRGRLGPAGGRSTWRSCGSTCPPPTRWTRPRYQPLDGRADRIASTCRDGAGAFASIAGEFDGHAGPAQHLHADQPVGRRTHRGCPDHPDHSRWPQRRRAHARRQRVRQRH